MNQVRVLMLMHRVIDGTEYEAGRFYMVSDEQAMRWLNEADPVCTLDDELPPQPTQDEEV